MLMVWSPDALCHRMFARLQEVLRLRSLPSVRTAAGGVASDRPRGRTVSAASAQVLSRINAARTAWQVRCHKQGAFLCDMLAKLSKSR